MDRTVVSLRDRAIIISSAPYIKELSQINLWKQYEAMCRRVHSQYTHAFPFRREFKSLFDNPFFLFIVDLNRHVVSVLWKEFTTQMLAIGDETQFIRRVTFKLTFIDHDGVAQEDTTNIIGEQWILFKTMISSYERRITVNRNSHLSWLNRDSTSINPPNQTLDQTPPRISKSFRSSSTCLFYHWRCTAHVPGSHSSNCYYKTHSCPWSFHPC